MDGQILMIIILVQFLPTDFKLIEKIHYIENEGVLILIEEFKKKLQLMWAQTSKSGYYFLSSGHIF